MKRFIFVILASLAGASTMSAVPVKAQSLTITTDDGGSYERADYRDRRWHRHERHEMAASGSAATCATPIAAPSASKWFVTVV